MVMQSYSFTGDPKVISEVAARAVSAEGLKVVETTESRLLFQKKDLYTGYIEFTEYFMQIDVSPTSTCHRNMNMNACFMFCMCPCTFPLIPVGRWGAFSRKPRKLIEKIASRIATELQAYPETELPLREK